MQASTAVHSSEHPDTHYGSALALEYALKRQYLALVPPQQVIEICLAFEIHAPAYVKSTVWPVDLKAAVAAMSGHSVANPQPSKSSETSDVPLMDSLLGDSSRPPPASTSEERPPSGTPHPEHQPTSNPTQQPSESTAPTNLPPPQASYPQQPYGYTPTQSEAAYPHTPYYPPPPPPGYPAYSAPYQAYPPPPHGYHPPHQEPPYDHSTLSNAHQPQDQYNNVSADDLPSYEEMLVEALTDAGDPEGCAPKELFTWMASHYPLQSNFRPSASQALQKAFKRGRLEKSNGGRYRLNATWEGGNTSRRTTRRPQTQSQTTVAVPNSQAPTSSPFTHAPLVHHHSTPASAPGQPYPGTGYSYPYHPPPHSGYPGFPSYPQQSSPAATDVAAMDQDNSTEEAGITWEAAQNILKAINLSRLIPLPSEHIETHNKEIGPAIDITENQVGPGDTSPMTGAEQTGVGVTGDLPDQNARSVLQAQLALLAAQLAEVVQAGDSAGAGLKGGGDMEPNENEGT